MSYRPQIKTSNGMSDLALDAETVKGVDVAQLFYGASKTYSSGDVCIYSGKMFVSLTNSNTGHTPDATQDTSYWARLIV